MILAALLLQAATTAPSPKRPAPAAKPVASAPKTPAPVAPTSSATPPDDPASPAPLKLKPLDAAAAVDAFKSICWAHFREPDDLAAAIPLSTIALAEAPRAHAGNTRTWRADEAILTYVSGDDLPAGVPSRQCTLRTKLAGAADQLTLAARVATALSLGNGRTQTGKGAARTLWDVRQPDGRVVRLIATTSNAAGGQSDLRLQALLLAQK